MSRPEPPVTEQERVRSRSVLRLTLALLAVAALFVVVMLAASLQGLPQFGPQPFRESEPERDPVIPPTQSPGPTAPMDPPEDSLLLAIIAIIVAALLGAVILVVVFFVLRKRLRFLIGLWHDRPLARREAAAVDAVSAPEAGVAGEPDTAVIRRGIAEALRTIDERPDPGDSIIAAWVGLEETATDAGAGRGINETPSEFTVRIVGRKSDISEDVSMLLGLYERVRFGGHQADEADRVAASACLRGIQRGWR
ncbi:DUF4129 domain-containing protein [Microbacterium sp. EST19A]|uniref:DUF4129 domain-containing protein n=1 Tax=Microbacterium sp. EST19A TaxID=2862681 RepID=UPI001CBFE834|nr:DUF4129 domain-containing protein [Microbacterium sp. EST19A]